MSPGDLAGRCVVVTGAGGGVGRGVALACGSAGAHVVVASPGENGIETVALVTGRGGTGEWVRTDVTRRGDVEAAVAAALKRTGRLDAMVHNATSRRSSEPAQLADLDPAVWEEHVAVSLRGAFYCAQTALPHLRVHGGRLVMFTSPAGMDGSAMLPAYGIVKAAIRGLTKSLACEWGPLGVTVAAVSPLAETPAMTNAYEQDPALEARLAARIPMGRIGDPASDVGPVVAFLIGDGARYITGQTIVVDGGRFTGL